MGEYIAPAILGIFLCIIGALNMAGDLRSLHWYHRQRVTEEDHKPFGRLIGGGNIIIGVSIMVFSALMCVSEINGSSILPIIATCIISFGVIAGLALSFYGMMKYNKGIF